MSSVDNLSPRDALVVVPSANPLSNVVGLYAGSDGDATIETRRGSTLTVKLFAGGSFICQITKVTAWTGTAGTLIALEDA